MLLGPPRRRTGAPTFLFAVAAILAAAPPVTAQECTPTTNVGCTQTNGCMEDIAVAVEGYELGCTANDVRVSGVADVAGPAGPGPDGVVDEFDITFEPVCDLGASNAGADCSGDPDICLDRDGLPAPDLCGDRCAYVGDTTSFAATFIVELSAQERFDIGLYFAIDGDPDGSGALNGTCSISTLPEAGSFTRPDASAGSYVDLDATCKGGRCPQPGDLCGDIDDDNNPIFYDLGGTFIEVLCVDPDNNEMLNLPNCTSWRQSGANEVCLRPVDAFPGSPAKCNCDPDFEVPIEVPPAKLEVVKTASPQTVSEPGGIVQFTVEVTNTGIDPNNPVTLTSLADDIHGDLSVSCVDANGFPLIGQTIPAGETLTCTFTELVSGNAFDEETDTVTATGKDTNGTDVEGSDDARVTVLDVRPEIGVDKTADPENLMEPGGDVTYTVVVSNRSVASTDPLTITELTDDIYGDLSTSCLDGDGQTLIGQVIQPDGSVTCTFTAEVLGNAGDVVTDVVTAKGVDDDTGQEVMAFDSAMVEIDDVLSMVDLEKTASPTMVFEPGGDVTFTLVVTNTSTVDKETIIALTDSIYGDLSATCLDADGQTLIGQMLRAGESATCTFTESVEGEGNTAETNTATVTVVDDDDRTLDASDDATVSIKDVAPAATLTKTATMAVVTYQVVVKNDSTAEALIIDALFDDRFGDITREAGPISRTTCATGILLQPKGEAGDSFTCEFDAKVATSPHVDTVTGTVLDNEGGEIMPSDDATVTFQ